VTGPNPTFVPAVANSPDLINWLTMEGESHDKNELLVWDAILNGELPWSLPGGAIGWAAGVQARNEKYDATYNDLGNRAADPCPWTNPFAVTLGFTTADQLSPNCTYKTGLVAFGVPNDEQNTKRTIYAAFTEFALPIADNVDMQFALRFEDYGQNGGSTIDPKVAIKWQAIDWLALRGSIGTTFRGPPLSYLSGELTYLANFPAPTSAYRAVNVIGNPDLQPERAIASNAGIIVELGGFTGTVDYWNFKFSDPFQTESYTQVYGLYNSDKCMDLDLATGLPGVGTNPANPNYAACQDLRTHIEPLGANQLTLAAVNTNIINGSNITTDGIDASLQYAFNLMGGELTVGTQGTYTLTYDSDDFNTLGGTFLAPGGDFVGYENIGVNPFYPTPDLKGNAFVRYAHNNWRFSYTARYVSALKDQNCRTPFSCSLTADQPLHDIDSMTTQDVTLIYTWRDLMVSGSVFNFMDKDPPQAAAAQEYDPYTHNPYGRMFKVELTYTMGGK
jgi:outer membrane receptor protein involved in Fe transport